MDKGIFYLICTVAILVGFAVVGYRLDQSIVRYCGAKTAVVTRTVFVTPTVTPTATPSAFLRRVTVAPVKPAVK